MAEWSGGLRLTRGRWLSPQSRCFPFCLLSGTLVLPAGLPADCSPLSSEATETCEAFHCCTGLAEQALESSLQALVSSVLVGQELVPILVALVEQVLALSKFLGLGLNFGLRRELELGLQEWDGQGLRFAQVPTSFDAQLKVQDQTRKGRALELLQILMEQYDGMNQIH